MQRMGELRAYLRRPYYLWLLADVQRAAGRNDAALAALTEALAVANANGEHWWTAEIHRLTGELTATLRTPTPISSMRSRRHALKPATHSRCGPGSASFDDIPSVATSLPRSLPRPESE